MADDELSIFDDDNTHGGQAGDGRAPEGAASARGAEGATDARHAGGSGRSRGRRALLVAVAILGVVVIAVAVVVGYYAKTVDNALSQAPRADLLPAVTPSGSGAAGVPSTSPGDAMNIVVMGSDSRGTDRGRSDTLIVMHINADRQKVYLISFPRDMWVPIPGYGKAKINAAYSWGGPVLTIRTLQELTNVQMDHAVITDFTGFTALVDEIGGVTVVNNQASASDGVTFPKGTITLNGKNALIYTRERYDLKNGDLDRAARQRDVITAIFNKVLTPEVLANPAKFNRVAQKIAPNVTVDSGFTNAAIEGLALSMRVTSISDVRSLQAPISGFGVSSDGQDYDVVNTVQMAQLSSAIANDTMDQYWQAHKNDPPITAP